MCKWSDLIIAFRQFRKRPWSTLAILLSIGLAIGANALVFTIVDAMILKPLVGFVEPRQLVLLWLRSQRQVTTALSYQDFQDYAHKQQSFESMAAGAGQTVTLLGRGDPREIDAFRVSREFLSATKMPPALGRGFVPEEFEKGRDGVFLATSKFWREHLGADPAAIGRPVSFDGVTRILVGVLPPRFNWFGASDNGIFVPLAPTGDEGQRGYKFLGVVGRLRTGVTLERARAEFASLTRGLVEEGAFPKGTGIQLQTLDDQVLGESTKRALWALSLTVFLVLLLTCVNVANLKVSRIAGRQREFAIRAAVGASQAQVLRQLMVESLLEAMAGGALGLALAYGGHQILQVTQLFPMGPVFDGRVDWRVAVFTLAISVLAALVFGLLPSLTVRNQDLAGFIKTASPGSGARSSAGRLSAVCVVVEVALAVVLVHGALMAIENLRVLTAAKPGIDTAGRTTIQFSLPEQQYRRRQRMAFYTSLLENLRTAPGVQAAALVSPLPLREGWLNDYFPEGRHPPAGEEAPVAVYYTCSPGYFSAAGIPILAGRDFVGADLDPNASSVIVSSLVAKRFWQSEANALGRMVELNQNKLTIVGVAGEVRGATASTPDTAAIYTPFSIYPPQQAAVIVRSTLPAATMAPALRQSVWRIDSHLALGDVESLDSIAGQPAADARQLGFALSGCAAAAMLITLIGLYGLTADMVANRLREIGIRRALGATDSSLLWTFARRGSSLAALGLVGGAALAYLLRHAAASVVPPIELSPVWIAGGVLATLITAILASVIPASAALRVQPERILRQE